MYGQEKKWIPEQRLVAAEISEWIATALGRGKVNNSSNLLRKRHLQRHALAYIYSADDGVGSFEQLCDILDIDAGYIKRKIREVIRSDRVGNAIGSGFVRRIK